MSSSSPENNPMPDKLFGYDVVSRLGDSPSSRVYAVTNASGQLFVLKHVVRETEKDDRFLQRIQNEYEMSRTFRHPGLRKAIEFKIPRRLFSSVVNEAALILEWIDGQPLDKNLPADPRAVLSIFSQMAAALAAMHYVHLVYCNFKPQNVLLCEGNMAKLIDFSQTCRRDKGSLRIQGTADFISPEQVKGAPVDFRTDVYSFGASLYWALTGINVPTYYTVQKSDRDIVKLQKYPSPLDLRPNLPEELSKLVMNCLPYHPDDRVPDMATVLNALHPLIALPTPAPAPVTLERSETKKPQPRRVTDWGL